MNSNLKHTQKKNIYIYSDCHRDSSSRARLMTLANHTEHSSNNNNNNNNSRFNANVDTCNTIDLDIDDLIIKSWCSRFCPRCYIYK